VRPRYKRALAARTLTPLLLALTLAACEPAPPRSALDREQLDLQLRELASLAAEASLFTREMAAGHLNGAYPWVQQQALAAQAGRIAGELAQPAPEALLSAQQEAMQLARRLQVALTRVAGTRDDPAQLQVLGEAFTAARSQARALGGTP
jgi:hypothetical protein